ncbi:MAG: carboxylating nicotinate-nucleotide diphosphorylase [Deltaproteobacteria bacterium]|nr:carboxylating nicotinate-nucleotide diphosphorylase [Deltaproteobacteria bacterium]MBW1870693.1 carboxylating nicotinate-nucleotide diphosphorylase [Deltaproteobacteria bacterium]
MNTTNPDPQLAALIDLALTEDLGSGDLTTNALFTARANGAAGLIARESLVVSGLDVGAAVFTRLDQACSFKILTQDGSRAKQGTVLARVHGPVRALLTGERLALNFIRHLSGIASLTREYVKALKGTGCTLLDTRKTTPGLRRLEKAAVRAGGGSNHRLGLFDGAMIKDNHISAAGSIRAAVNTVRKSIPPTLKIEVECSNLKQVRDSLAAGADIIMLDNMPPEKMAKAVTIVNGQAATEASGNITLNNIRAVAKSGVDFISVGAITHGARSVDISMELE